jgi:exopolysaccharide biosynthesis WecB/TagA/CpsF family protein
MRILLPTMRDPGQIGGTSTHIAMLTRGLEEIGHVARPLYLGATIPEPLRTAGLIWPAGALNRMRTGWGMMYSAEARGRLLAAATQRELARAASAWAQATGDPEGVAPWQVLNAQEVYSIPYLRAVADEYGVPLVLTLHGYPLYESLSEGFSRASQMGRHYLMRSEMRALRLADAVVTVDSRLYRHALRLVPERSGSIYALMNFIDTSAFAPPEDAAEEQRLRRQLRTAWDIPVEKVVLFCPRRLVKKNGVIYPSLALAAMAQVDRERFLLLHAGEGGEREEMERIIRENRLEKNVRLLGGQCPDAVRDLYRLADIVLVPSVHSENVEEATSLSALEAMASSRPLIAGDVGGLAEMVVDGETGLLVPADAEAVAAAILRLVAAPELGARLAAAARTYVVENHSHLRAAAAYAEVYRRAAAAAHGATASLAAAQPAAEPAPPWPTISVLGFPLDLVTLEQAAQWTLTAAMGAGAPTGRTAIAVSFNPELVMRAQRDPAAAEALLKVDLCYPDGVGAVWAAGRQGARQTTAAFEPAVSGRSATASGTAPERVAGIDLAQRVLGLAARHGLPVFLLGAAEGVADEAARRQTERLPGLRIAGTHHGYFSPAEEDEVVQAIRDSGARILLVAMGAPRQEVFLYRRRYHLGVPVALGVGGSFDVWAGTVKRAPVWTQRARVEWLYRLASDPRRLRRQTALPRYVTQVVRWSPDDYGPARRGRARPVAANGEPGSADACGGGPGDGDRGGGA